MSIGNRILYADDCLDVLTDEAALPSESVDLIYLDPPFNSKSDYNLPFKGKYKNAKPVEAFTDTWRWGKQQDEHLEELHDNSLYSTQKKLAEFVDLVRKNEGPRGVSLSAYLINMAVRLLPMKRILKDTGSIYLHCDPAAGHYLKLTMDFIFGERNFRNEILWRIGWVSGYKTQKKGWIRNHDIILYYIKTQKAVAKFNKEYLAYPEGYVRRDGKPPTGKGFPLEDSWNCHSGDVLDSIMIKSFSTEKLGYPTQKPLALLERIIRASSDEGDLVLDPFCGCGTTVHAAEALKRNWIGIDISNFAVGLIRERLANNIPKLKLEDITSHGIPYDVAAAKALAKKDKFEFEKWVCGAIGAHGMFHDPGDKGPDGGVDGIIEFGLFTGLEEKVRKTYAIVQVKGGRVTADSVRALYATVERYGAAAGIFVCFEKHMKTVENNRSKKTFEDGTGEYPVIQGFSIEQLLNNEKPRLPPLKFRKDARLKKDLFNEDAQTLI